MFVCDDIIRVNCKEREKENLSLSNAEIPQKHFVESTFNYLAIRVEALIACERRSISGGSFLFPETTAGKYVCVRRLRFRRKEAHI